jgi:hypothetical protein
MRFKWAYSSGGSSWVDCRRQHDRKASLEGGELLAGTAKINITPENPQKPVHDNVNARVLVLEIAGKRLAFVSVDLGVIWLPRVRRNSGFHKFC